MDEYTRYLENNNFFTQNDFAQMLILITHNSVILYGKSMKFGIQEALY